MSRRQLHTHTHCVPTLQRNISSGRQGVSVAGNRGGMSDARSSLVSRIFPLADLLNRFLGRHMNQSKFSIISVSQKTTLSMFVMQCGLSWFIVLENVYHLLSKDMAEVMTYIRTDSLLLDCFVVACEHKE